MKINSPEELDILLRINQIDTNLWGIDGAKTINQLYDEITSGDCVLCNESELVRKVKPISLIISGTNEKSKYFLIEESQLILIDGIEVKRQRMTLPTEKRIGHEELSLAIKRAVKEELAMESNPQVSFVNTDSEIKWKDEDKLSKSYPGLRSSYDMIQIEIIVKNLPETVDTFGTSEEHMRHNWKWIEKSTENLKKYTKTL